MNHSPTDRLEHLAFNQNFRVPVRCDDSIEMPSPALSSPHYELYLTLHFKKSNAPTDPAPHLFCVWQVHTNDLTAFLRSCDHPLCRRHDIRVLEVAGPSKADRQIVHS